MSKPEGLWRIGEAAVAMGLKEKTLRQKIWKRQIEFVRVGCAIRFKPSTITRLIEAGTVPALERPPAPPPRKKRKPVRKPVGDAPER